MLATNPELDARPRAPAPLRSDLDQLANAFLVQRHEGVFLVDALLRIDLQEPAGIVAADTQRGLRQVVGAE